MMGRRRFIEVAGSGLAAGLGTALAEAKQGVGPDKIEKIELFPLRYPMVGYFKFFADPKGAAGRAAVVVKITTSSGIGWGESVPLAKWSYETIETTEIALRDYYAPALIGHDACDIDGAHKRMDGMIAPGFSTGMPISRAGIDIALWDLAGKRSNKSLHTLWGRDSVVPLELSWTLNVKGLADIDRVVAEGRKRGYRNLNIKVGPDPEFDVKLAKAARAAMPDGFLWADANGGYTAEAALEAAPRLADAGVDILEAPLHPNEIRGYQALKKQGALPILMDEGVISPRDLEEFIALKMLDGIACKPSRCGGLTSNKRQIELIQKHGLMWVGSGLTDPDISLAATLQLYTAFGLQKPAALNGPQFLSASMLKQPIEAKDGKVACPKGAGLGIEVDEAKLREHVKRSGFEVAEIT